MKLSNEQIHYLQKLGRLNIDNTDDFLIKLEKIIAYLEDFANTESKEDEDIYKHSHTLVTKNSTTPPGEKGLLQNVEHEMLNNSIVIHTKL